MQSIYWEIDVLKGGSTSVQGKDMIEVLSFSHGVSMPVTMGPSSSSRTSGRCVHQDFTLTKFADPVSPALNLKCCGGENIRSMKLHIWKTDDAGKPVECQTYTFTDSIITSVSIGGGGGSQPTETLTFNYKTITWDFPPAAAPGLPKLKNAATWSLEQNKGM